jgi:hypothetical protein
MEPPVETQSQDDNTPLMKPKRTRTMTEEAKKQYAERMKKVNEERIKKAQLASAEALALKEQKLKEKLEKVETKKQQVKKLKEDEDYKEKQVVPPEGVPAPLKKDKPVKISKQKARRIVVQESSDSDDYFEGETDGESSDTEVIYVAKSKSKKQSTITKAKKEKEIPVRQPEVPKTVIKFF